MAFSSSLRALAAVRRAGLASRVFDGSGATARGHVAVGTMHLAKWLEFRAVVVAACDDEIVPLQARIEGVADEADLQDVYDTERHLLYVACTRAREHLLMTGVAPASEFLDDLVPRQKLAEVNKVPRARTRGWDMPVKDPKKAEFEFSRGVYKAFQDRLARSPLRRRVAVEERRKILKDLTIARDRERRWRLIAGFQQQDLVFYCPADAISMTDFKSDFVRVDKYDRTEQVPVLIPLVVCELKIGRTLTTHAMITYSAISSLLRSIFPHCAYFLIIDSDEERRLHSTGDAGSSLQGIRPSL